MEHGVTKIGHAEHSERVNSCELQRLQRSQEHEYGKYPGGGHCRPSENI